MNERMNPTGGMQGAVNSLVNGAIIAGTIIQLPSVDIVGHASGSVAAVTVELRNVVNAEKNAAKPLVRRVQGRHDVTQPSERAARRESMRRYGVPTSRPNNYERVDNWDKNPNLRGPQGQPSEKILATDGNGKDVVIDHHNWGHKFEDNGTFEMPHYHDPNGDHVSYPPR